MAVGRKEGAGLWRLCVDTGGTFTDCLATDPVGRSRRLKVLSSSTVRARVAACEGPRLLRAEGAWPRVDGLFDGFRLRRLGSGGAAAAVVASAGGGRRIELDQQLHLESGDSIELISPEPAPLLAARLLTATPARAALPALTMRLATTRGTNALLTRGGTPPVFFVNRGFADLLRIGTQARPEIFALEVLLPEPLHGPVVELGGRLDAEGREIEPLDEAAIRRAARRELQTGGQVAAVALLHADRNPDHEQRVARILAEEGFAFVSCSARLAPFIGLLPRAQTAVIDAYLRPVVQSYLERIRAELENNRLLVMTSSGGLIPARGYAPKDSLLSGPAGGICGAAAVGRETGHTRLLGFDMGGTSTDVARFDGDFEYVREHGVGDARLVAPSLAIETVAAGGGSVCCFDGVALRVGPESAGAEPGPACYGAGGPLAVTDVNLLLGRIDPERFEIPLDLSAAAARVGELQQQLEEHTSQRPGRDELLIGLLELANEKMADAIRKVSIRRGYDPADHALVVFGGAGPQHGFAVAEKLGIRTVIVPRDAGLLSARGLAAARQERFADRQVLRPLDEVAGEFHRLWDELLRRAREELAGDGADPAQVVARRHLAELRFSGQDATLTVDISPESDPAAAFRERYETVFGHLPPGRKIELVSLRLVASAEPDEEALGAPTSQVAVADGDRRQRCFFHGGFRLVPLFARRSLRPGDWVQGPCLVSERYSVTVVEPGWRLEVDSHGHLVGRRLERPRRARNARPAAVEIELFSQAATRIAEEMGEALRRSAISTNIKERLDYSCAVLDPRGELVVNAPHIPVHLGSLGHSVREVDRLLSLGPGDTAVTNHPAFGGSHLPDVTLVTPAFHHNQRVGFVASRAHHAEIGGLLPGSMPPTATCLAEEGVVIPPTPIARGGKVDWEPVRRLLEGGPYPSRAVEDNLADLRAALAANLRGAREVEALAAGLGADALAERMDALCSRAERRVRQVLGEMGSLYCREIERLDDGTEIPVTVRCAGGELAVSFEGAAGVHPGNLNATPAIVTSAVLYVLRLMLRQPLPLNEGLLRAVRLTVPPGVLSPPFTDDPLRCPAVVGGNVEISQRLVNAMLRALGLAASSQGTMNNLLFGDAERSYYETICGGCGAGPGFDGASAVHSHMTNTRITDAEILEHRYPVRVERFAIRRGSGGAGRHRGGDGAIRELSFLAPLSVCVLGQHRLDGPEGLRGGAPGAPGRVTWVRDDGSAIELAASDARTVSPGDRLLIETPGGGGYGEAQRSSDVDLEG